MELKTVVPVEVQIGDSMHGGAKMKISVELQPLGTSISGDALFEALTNKNVPKFLRVLANEIEKQLAANRLYDAAEDYLRSGDSSDE